MNWAKLVGIGAIVIGEIQKDLKDGKITIDEIIDTTKAVVDKLGYGSKNILDFLKKD